MTSRSSAPLRLRALVAVALPLLLALAGCGRERPSVLLVTLDTFRADAVGPRTPRLVRLAGEGLAFTRAETACPLTLPSHATILSGRLPAEHGLTDNDPLHPLAGRAARGFPMLAESLADAGYDTAAFVSSTILSSRTGIAAGFSRYDGPLEGVPGPVPFAERVGGRTVARAIAWMRGARRPFFAFVHLFDAHEPYLPPEGFRSGAAPGSPAAYGDEVAYVDHCVGELLDALDELGRGGNTLVVVTADHGEGLGEHGERTHGFFLNETTTHVPLIVRWPGRLPVGATRGEPVGLAEIAPAVLAAAGLRADRSSILDGPPDRSPVAETRFGRRHMGWARLFAAWEGDEKLVVGATSASYDLASDPHELRPSRGVPRALADRIDAYLRLGPPGAPDPAELAPLVGLPYLNATRPASPAGPDASAGRTGRDPDPELVEEIFHAVGRVGKADPATVERELAGLLARDPGNPTLLYWRGRNAVLSGDLDTALRSFVAAFAPGRAAPRRPDPWLGAFVDAARALGAGRRGSAASAAARAVKLARTDEERRISDALAARVR